MLVNIHGRGYQLRRIPDNPENYRALIKLAKLENLIAETVDRLREVARDGGRVLPLGKKLETLEARRDTMRKSLKNLI